MPVSYQANRLMRSLILSAIACCLTVTVSAQDITLDDADFGPKPQAAVKQTTREQLIREQVAAGEFGPAMKTAQAAKTPAERARLLKLIADAQMNDGELDLALNSVRMVPRSQTSNERRKGEGLLGGLQADFQTLTQLIVEQTSPPAQWVLNGDDPGGTIQPFPNGVLVEPGGVIRTASKLETSGRLNGLVNRARNADLEADLAEKSDLRFVSLRRLDQAVTERRAAGLPIVETMRNLGGLVRLRYVMVLPEEQDIIIGGPAEPWRYDETGQPVGQHTGRPTLQLDDLVTLMRTFSQSGSRRFLCSIDPRPAGMKAITEYVERTNGKAVSNIVGYKRDLQNALGMQDVRLEGIPNDSRVARVIVEADYRMKMIGIGKLKGVDGIESFFDLLPKVGNASPKKMDALRWWLTMNYDAILHNEDRTAYEIKGSSVLCMSENQLVNAKGERVATGKSEPVNRMFAEKFTNNYEKLAARDLVFADLQNVFDLALVAALILDERLDAQIDWDRGTFARGGYETVRYEPPRQVMSVVNHRTYQGRELVVQVAGGVNGDVMGVVRKESGRAATTIRPSLTTNKGGEIPPSAWWWNGK